MKKVSNQFTFRILFTLILVFSFSTVSFGQNKQSDEQSVVVIPEQAMKQIVRRILIWSFKPRKQTTKINLAKNIWQTEQEINADWLPEIKNIELQLLSAEEIKQKEIKVYFFTAPVNDGNKFNIDFAFGNPDCDSFGDSWNFRIIKEKVRLWKSGGMGTGCWSSPAITTNGYY